MKQWERDLQVQQHAERTGLRNRLLYAAIGMISGGLLAVVLSMLLADFDLMLFLVPGAVLVFGVWGFLRGDRMVETLGALWEDLMNRG